jgi:serine/threonine protein kinase
MPSRIGDYTLTKTLGCGITSKVKLAHDSQGNAWAIKIFDKTNPNVTEGLLKALQSEVGVLKKLNHDNIVNMKEFSIDGVWEKASGNKPVAYIVLELLEEGELFDFIAIDPETHGPFSEEICRYYFR